MKEKFEDYWSIIPMLYSFAFILDPRAKIRGFTNVLQIMSKLTDENYSEYLTTVRANLSDTFAKYDSKFGAVRLQRATVLGPASGKRKTAWGQKFCGTLGGGLDAGASLAGGLGTGASLAAAGLGAGASLPPGLVGGASSSTRRPSACALLQAAHSGANLNASELAAYLDSDPVNQYDDDFNILNWWHEHKLSYPVLSILAKDVLTMPVSTISLESAFSLTGRIIEERRQRLTSDTVEMLSLVKDWEQADTKTQHIMENVELHESFENLYLDENV